LIEKSVKSDYLLGELEPLPKKLFGPGLVRYTGMTIPAMVLMMPPIRPTLPP